MLYSNRHPPTCGEFVITFLHTNPASHTTVCFKYYVSLERGHHIIWVLTKHQKKKWQEFIIISLEIVNLGAIYVTDHPEDDFLAGMLYPWCSYFNEYWLSKLFLRLYGGIQVGQFSCTKMALGVIEHVGNEY